MGYLDFLHSSVSSGRTFPTMCIADMTCPFALMSMDYGLQEGTPWKAFEFPLLLILFLMFIRSIYPIT